MMKVNHKYREWMYELENNDVDHEFENYIKPLKETN